MDEATVSALTQALETSPDNLSLFAVVLRQLHERGEHDRGLALLRAHGPRFEAPPEQVLAASVARQAGDPALSLEHLVSEAPPCLVERARALIELGRSDDAQDHYQRAVAQSPSLQDRELERRFGPDGPDNLRRLRVVAWGSSRPSRPTRAARWACGGASIPG